MKEKSEQSHKNSPFRACLELVSGGLGGQLYLTEDGSHTLFVPEIDECYHSTKGAIQESRHIFIEAGLKQSPKFKISVLEIGFGTGLNALLTAHPLPPEGEYGAKKINYTAIELYPVSNEQASKLNYPELLAKLQISNNLYSEYQLPLQANDLEESICKIRGLFEKIHICEWNKPIQITDNFTLTKFNSDFTKIDLEGKFDVIYFDAFSPEKQPEMWSEEMFKKLYLCAADNAVLTTYCAKGAVRRAMQSAGFSVERLPGPPGKREILRAKKTQ